VAVLVLADVLLEELPRVLLGHSAADTIGIPVAIVALPLVASYTICMYFRARQLDHLIDETVASGLAARSIAESTSRGRLLPKWVVATLAAVGIVVVLSIIAQAILRP
jgi:hypothetical protein